MVRRFLSTTSSTKISDSDFLHFRSYYSTYNSQTFTILEVRRVCSFFTVRVPFFTDLGETGDDQSDSESSSEECAQTFQNHWFHSLSQVEFDDVKRNLRLSRLYNDLRRQLYQIKQNKCKLPVLSEKFMRPFVEVAETNPAEAASCLNEKEQLPVNT